MTANQRIVIQNEVNALSMSIATLKYKLQELIITTYSISEMHTLENEINLKTELRFLYLCKLLPKYNH